ncbi:MAG: hypothetical protein Kow00120_00490 [Anaerolineae bacterium]
MSQLKRIFNGDAILGATIMECYEIARERDWELIIQHETDELPGPAVAFRSLNGDAEFFGTFEIDLCDMDDETKLTSALERLIASVLESEA